MAAGDKGRIYQAFQVAANPLAAAEASGQHMELDVFTQEMAAAHQPRVNQPHPHIEIILPEATSPPVSSLPIDGGGIIITGGGRIG